MIGPYRFPAMVLATLSLAAPALAAEQDAIDGCIDAVRERVGLIGGEILNSSFSEAATEVYLMAADRTYWRCLAYSDGAVGELTEVSEADLPDFPDPFEPTRVTFDAGASGATYEATIEAGGVAQYVLGASESQTMSVAIDPMGADMYYQIIGPDNSRLIGGTDATEAFSGVLPASGDYTVEIVSQADAPAEYSISFEID